MILDIHAVQKNYPGREVLKDISFHLEEKQKCALIGKNGCGKSTLLKIIAGEIPPDSGSTFLKKDCRLAYLPQQIELAEEIDAFSFLFRVRQDLLDMDQAIRALAQEIAETAPDARDQKLRRYAALQENFERADGYAYRSKVEGVLRGLGFSEAEKGLSVSSFSGGQKTRLLLGALLLQDADLLLLDEPTNHLDLSSISWLENYLSNYDGAVLIVSHDRYFLNRLVTQVVEIERGCAVSYQGDYDAFAEKKAENRRIAYRAYLKASAAVKHEEAVIAKLRSFNREKSIRRAESREKKLAKMEVPNEPQREEESIRMHFTPAVTSGRDVLTVTQLSKSFSSKALFHDVSFLIQRGEHVGLLGANGSGKSTLLKIINEQMAPDAGTIQKGANVQIAYYDQEMQLLTDENTVLEELQDAFPHMRETDLRNTLAAFLFIGDEVKKQIAALSGGERARLSLCKQMLSDANFLILDEPTNHLDIESREVLESALEAYEGTILFVSHDRYFINKIATRIFALEDGSFRSYQGNYQYYLEKSIATEQAPQDRSKATETAAASIAKQDWKAQKQEEARLRKIKNDLARCEAAIEEKETALSLVQEQMSAPEIATDHMELTKHSREAEAIQAELDALYRQWESLASLSDND